MKNGLRENVTRFLKRCACFGLSRIGLVQSVLFRLRSSVALHGLSLCENDRKMLALKNAHAGERCFIIGNGPSLRISDLDLLKNEFTIAANKIFLAFDSTEWRPTYYNVEDPLVINQNAEKINSLKGFSKILRWTPGTKFRKDENTFWYHMKVLKENEYPKFSFNPLRSLYCGYSVTYTSLQLAFYLGFSEIYLIGIDFSFDVPDPDNTGKIISKGESNHFVANYREPGEVWMIPKLELQEIALRYAQQISKAYGVPIYNSTRGGRLEVFPRVSFDSLFEKKE